MTNESDEDVDEPWREPPTIRRVSLAPDYHDLLHRWLTGPCRDPDQGGRWRGPARHLAHRWEFTWGPRLRAWTLCRLGRHAPTTLYGRHVESRALDDGSVGVVGVGGYVSRQRVCLDCARELGPIQRRPEGGEW